MKLNPRVPYPIGDVKEESLVLDRKVFAGDVLELSSDGVLWRWSRAEKSRSGDEG